jgi:hypothetical protein
MNAGLESTRSVLVTAGAPATPIDPFRVYVVGTLDPDDISTFEVTFQTDTGVTEIPLVVEYRDDDGNLYTATRPISLENRTGEEDGDGGILVPAAVAGYARRTIRIVDGRLA